MERETLDSLVPTSQLGPYHDFTDSELAPYREVFGSRPAKVRRFDPEHAIVRAKLSRVNRDGRGWNDRTWASDIWDDTESVVSADEARFWLGLILRTPFEEDGVQEDLSYIDAASPIEATMDAATFLTQLVDDGGEADSFLAELLVEHRPYLEVLEAVLGLPDSSYVGQWVRAMGPPPVADRQQALDRVDAFLTGLGDAWLSTGYEGLLTALPHPDWIERAVLNGAARGFVYMGEAALIRQVQDPETFRRLSTIAREHRSHPWEEDVVAWVARFGTDDIDGLFDLVVRRDPSQYWEPLYAWAFRVRDPAWVRLLQPLATRRKSAPLVERYLRQEGINAVEGLLQLVNTRGKKRLWALEWLDTLAEDASRREMIEARLPHHPKVAADVRERLGDTGPAEAKLTELPAWVTDLEAAAAVPPWLNVARIEPALLASEKALPAVCLESLVCNPPTDPSATCDIKNRGAVAWSLIDQWEFREADGDRAIHAVALLATEHEAAKLAALLRARDAWPPKWRGGRGERLRAISTLAAINLPGARRGLASLLELHAEELRKHVRSEIAQICRRHGWSRRDYDDFSVPDMGLDAQGERLFDYGARQIRLVLHGRHDVVFTDESSGKEYKRLPPAKKADDAELVQRAREEWALLKKPLVEVFEEQNSRFERAMVHGRSWRLDAWFERIVGHRILGHLARRVVWAARRDEERVAFKWSPEGDAHDAAFDPVDLAAFERVELAHPANLANSAAWVETFVELEIVQPFDQLGWPRALSSDLEPGATLDGQKLADRAVRLGWELSGARWYRAPILTLKHENGQAAVVELEHGIEISGTRRVKPHQSEQTLKAISATMHGEQISIDRLIPSLASEMYWLLRSAQITPTA